MSEVASLPLPKNIVPFSSELICPSCGARDVGSYCSECSNSLQITRGQGLLMLVNRLHALGYRTLDELRLEKPVDDFSIYRHFSFAPLQLPTMTLLALPFLGQAGVCLDLLVIGSAMDVTGEVIQHATDEFFKQNQDLIISQQATERTAEQLFEKISVRYLMFVENKTIGQELVKLSGKHNIKVSRGKRSIFAFWRCRAFKARLDWSVSAVVMDTCEVLEGSRRIYDAVGHEAMMSVRQTQKFEKRQEEKTLYSQVVRGVFENVSDYFVSLFQFLRNRYLFADLIVHKHYISVERIIAYYIAGIAVSVALPMALTFGAITPADLLTFNNLPPFVDEIAELLWGAAWIALEAMALHVGLRLMGYRGRFKLLLMSLFFIYAFFQIFDRPFEYVISGPLLQHARDTGDYLRLANNLGQVRWVLFAYLLLPFIYAVYRAGPKAAGVAYTAVAITFMTVQVALSGVTIFQSNFVEEAQFEQVLQQETRILEEYTHNVLPLLEVGDRTGDYSAGLSKLEPLIHDLDDLAAQTSHMVARLDGKGGKEKALLLDTYIKARHDVIAATKEFVQGEMSVEQYNAIVDRVKNASEAYNRNGVAEQIAAQ